MKNMNMKYENMKNMGVGCGVWVCVGRWVGGWVGEWVVDLY